MFKSSSLLDCQFRELISLMDNPLIMLQQINDRQINRKIPTQLQYSSKSIEILTVKIQVFLSLRYIVSILGGTKLQGDSLIKELDYQGIDVNPIAREQRVIDLWEERGSYQLPSINVELILCNQKLNKKMQVRYVMIDPEYFILIEPDFTVQNENRIKVHQRVPLRHVESLVDKND